MDIKVLLDVTAMAGTRPTGIGNYTRRLLGELAEVDGVDVAASWRPGGSRRRENLIPLLPGGIVARPWLPVISGLNLHRFDLYHGTDGRIPTGSRFRTVVTVHDLAIYEPGLLEESFARQGRERLETMLHAGRPDRIITISEFTRTKLVERFPHLETITRVVPLGTSSPIDSPSRTPEGARGSASLHLPATPKIPFLLSPGTIERRKNQIATIHAFEIIKRTCPDLQLVIAGGEGFDAEAAVRAIEISPVRDSIIRLGYVSDDELAELYRSAVASIYPSHYEGFGLPILEAMAAGCPVVTSDRGAMIETAGDAAIHADPDDPDAIAAAIFRLLDDPALRSSLIDAGLERAAYFSWKRCAERTVDVYREIANG